MTSIEQLQKIIALQTEISRHGLDLGAAMALVVQGVLDLYCTCDGPR